jgi:hypothetical protein
LPLLVVKASDILPFIVLIVFCPARWWSKRVNYYRFSICYHWHRSFDSCDLAFLKNHFAEGVEKMIVRMNGKIEKSVSLATAVDPGREELVWRLEKPGKAVYVTGGLTALIPAYQGIATILSEAVICFAGTAWMFGHRTEAIEKLIGAAAGLLIILQAHNIVIWLKGLLA